jgi:hypothetical protein
VLNRPKKNQFKPNSNQLASKPDSVEKILLHHQEGLGESPPLLRRQVDDTVANDDIDISAGNSNICTYSPYHAFSVTRQVFLRFSRILIVPLPCCLIDQNRAHAWLPAALKAHSC